MHGRGTEDLRVRVPQGTTVRDAETGKVITDLIEHGQEIYQWLMAVVVVVEISVCHAKKNPAPEISENGEPGQERELQLELKILADVGLVGFPSVGKSTCSVSSLQPNLKSVLHFTTIVPNLGRFVRSQVNLLQ